MEQVLLVIHVIFALCIIGVVLLQPPENSSLGGLGGSNPMAGTGARGQGNILTRATAIFATLFIITSLVLAVLAAHQPKKNSILDSVAATTEAAPDKAAKPQATTETAPSVPVAK